MKNNLPSPFENTLRFALLAVVIVGFVQYGSTKHKGTVTIYNADADSAYLVDNGSYVTNAYVHLNLTRSVFLPDTADFYGYYRSVDETNQSDWVQFIDTTMASMSFPTNIPFANAISNDFCFGTGYVRQQTHTNGVAELKWLLVPNSPTNAPTAFPLRTSINYQGENQ